MAGDEQLSASIVESLITALAYVGQEAAPLLAVLQPEDFEGIYADLAERILRYRKQYKEPPAPAHLDDIFDHVLSDINHKEYRQYNRILIGIRETAPNLNVRYLIDRVTSFARQQRLKEGVLRAAERYDQGGDTVAEDVERILHGVLKQNVVSFNVGERLSDNVLSFLGRDEYAEGDKIRTGIKQLDQFGLVPTRRELWTLMAPKKKGKCGYHDALVLLADGSRKKLGDVVRDRDRRVVTFNTDTGLFEATPVSDYVDSGVQECFRVTFVTGVSTCITREHPLLSGSGWRALSDIGVGGEAAVPKHLPGLGTGQCSASDVRLLGYLIADGGLSNRSSIGYTKTDKRIVEDFIYCTVQHGSAVVRSTIDSRQFYVVRGSQGVNTVLNWVRALGLSGKRSREKAVPEFVFRLTDDLLAEFLRALLSSDGCLTKNTFEIILSSSRLTYDVQHLLTRLGIVSRAHPKKIICEGKELPDYVRLTVRGKRNLLRFVDVVGWTREGGEAHVAALRAHLLNVADYKDHGTNTLSDQAHFCKISSIESIGFHRTYDLSIPHNHNFVVDDVIIHNSWGLQHICKQAARQRLNAAYVSLENRTAMVKQRFVQSWMSAAKRDEEYVRAELIRNSKGRLSTVEYENARPDFAFDRPDDVKALEVELHKHRFALGRIFIGEFSSGTLTVAGLENWLDTIENEHGFVPDVIAVDYPQLMKLDSRDLRASFGRVTVELRGLAGDRNAAMVTAVQSNRASETAKIVRSDHAAEDISQIATADTVITYNQTAMERSLGLARLHVAAARNDLDQFTIMITQAYAVGRFAGDSCMFGSDYEEILSVAARALERENGRPDDRDRVDDETGEVRE